MCVFCCFFDRTLLGVLGYSAGRLSQERKPGLDELFEFSSGPSLQPGVNCQPGIRKPGQDVQGLNVGGTSSPIPWQIHRAP